MEQLVGHFVELFSTHFDLSFMLCVNVLTYILIKVIDDINGDKSVGTWTKRLVMLISCFANAAGYVAGGYENTTFLFNSASSLEDCSNSMPLYDTGLTLPYLALLGCAILLPVVTNRKFSEVRKSAKKYLSRIGFKVISSSFLNHVLSKSDYLLSTLSPCLASINS